MPININAAPDAATARSKNNKKKAKEDPDFALFSAMTADEAAQWVDDNCTADSETTRVLKVMMRTFTGIAGDL